LEAVEDLKQGLQKLEEKFDKHRCKYHDRPEASKDSGDEIDFIIT
jgi:hypothetical protein